MGESEEKEKNGSQLQRVTGRKKRNVLSL